MPAPACWWTRSRRYLRAPCRKLFAATSRRLRFTWAGKCSILPDLVLVEDGNRYGAIGYGELRTQFAPSNFIETGQVPSDAEVVGHTWAHPNKSGGPDRRFKNNRQIPVCRYEALRLSSGSGLNELVEFSKTNVSQPFLPCDIGAGATAWCRRNILASAKAQG